MAQPFARPLTYVVILLAAAACGGGERSTDTRAAFAGSMAGATCEAVSLAESCFGIPSCPGTLASDDGCEPAVEGGLLSCLSDAEITEANWAEHEAGAAACVRAMESVGCADIEHRNEGFADECGLVTLAKAQQIVAACSTLDACVVLN